jgi:hypothetical protein
VKNKPCGGLQRSACEVKGQVCENDEPNSCDLLKDGNDCTGFCVWPLSLRSN